MATDRDLPKRVQRLPYPGTLEVACLWQECQVVHPNTPNATNPASCMASASHFSLSWLFHVPSWSLVRDLRMSLTVVQTGLELPP